MAPLEDIKAVLAADGGGGGDSGNAITQEAFRSQLESMNAQLATKLLSLPAARRVTQLPGSCLAVPASWLVWERTGVEGGSGIKLTIPGGGGRAALWHSMPTSKGPSSPMLRLLCDISKQLT